MSTARAQAPRGLRVAGVLLAALAALYLVGVVYAVGQTLLAGTLLVIVALAAWTYTSTHTTALRYLFPGVAAAMVFVVFPMLYTIGIGFTNYSSRNLLDFERARQYLLDETVAGEGAGYAFTLHADLHQFRLRLVDADDEAKAFVSAPLALRDKAAITVDALPEATAKVVLGEPLTLKDVIARQADLKALALKLPDGTLLRMTSLRRFGQARPAYTANADGSLTRASDGMLLRPNRKSGYFETSDGERKEPGFTVSVGLDHYVRIFTDAKFREPFGRIFLWTLAFSALSVLFSASLGLFLAVLLNWEPLRFKGAYRLVLFLPYAVPGFISILVFKGLFNQNLGEVNLILHGLFGIKPAWFSDPLLAKAMLLIVNIWLGFPYMMVLCSGLIQSIPADLYEASAVVGAGPWTNFRRITLPLIMKPLTPLLISAFAFNFNNFVLVSLLTNGRPDQVDSTLPAGTTDILVSYTWRIAFQDNGQQFGLAAAISTVIFLMVAAVTLIQMKLTLKEERR